MSSKSRVSVKLGFDNDVVSFVDFNFDFLFVVMQGSIVVLDFLRQFLQQVLCLLQLFPPVSLEFGPFLLFELLLLSLYLFVVMLASSLLGSDHSFEIVPPLISIEGDCRLFF